MIKKKIKLLVINPTMDLDDDNQFFLHMWISKMLPSFSEIDVITLKKGRITESPKLNVFGLNLFKNKISKFINFYKWAFWLVPKCDVILTQMFPEFPIFIYPLALIFRKPIIMYYAHSGISLRLKISHLLVKKVVTTSKNGFLLNSKKAEILGQGIDSNVFKPSNSDSKEKKYIYCADRIDRSKGQDVVIQALAIIKRKKLYDLPEIRFYGRKDEQYFKEINNLVKENDLQNLISFFGSVTSQELITIANESLFFVTGNRVRGLSKAALEAMACGRPAILCDEDYFSSFGKYKDILYYKRDDPNDLANKIVYLLKNQQNLNKIGEKLRKNVSKFHNIENFIDRLTKILLYSS